MTAARARLYALLVVVAVTAAVLSFAALRDLATACGFAPWLAWLLPVVIDAGAAAGALTWLGRDDGPGHRFGRALALTLLTTSVAGNAISHALAAYSAKPAWWLVVAVSAIAPAVLGAVVHLAVLVSRGEPVSASVPPAELAELEGEVETLADVAELETEPAESWEDLRDRLLAEGVGRGRLSRELGITAWEARQLRESHARGREEAGA